MSLRIYDTLAREKRTFEPLEPGKVRMYVCGVTVYDLCHVGHGRSAIVFDVIHRWLREKGYDVTFVRNFTDIDDKIIRRAQERGVTSEAIASEYIDAFARDMGALGLMAPTVEPKATEHVPEMIEVIGALIDRGLAYRTADGVYFAVGAYPRYGRLSRRTREELLAGARVAVDEAKRDPADFALWKAAKPGEPEWDSPWGKGRPGWHIECSAMSMKYLGQPFDIHGGGEDLIFPHHENEIAQSEGARGRELARYWVHNGFLNLKSEKMSKSLGNVVTVRELVARWPAEAFRLLVLSADYRHVLDFTEEAMAASVEGLERLYRAVDEADRRIAGAPGAGPGPASEADLEELARTADARFADAMDDDFNTARASGVLFELARGLNRLTARAGWSAADRELAERLRGGLLRWGRSLGLLSDESAHMLERLRAAGVAKTGLDAAAIEAKIAERRQARERKEFKKADEVRAWLAERGITLEDSPSGTTWRVS